MAGKRGMEHAHSSTQDKSIEDMQRGALSSYGRGVSQWMPDFVGLPGDIADAVAFAGRKVLQGQQQGEPASLGAGAALRRLAQERMGVAKPRPARAEMTAMPETDYREEAVRLANPLMFMNPLKAMAVVAGATHGVPGGLGVIKNKTPSLPTETLAQLRSLILGKPMDVERGAVVLPNREPRVIAGTSRELNWDKGIRGGLFKRLDGLNLTDAEAKQAGNMHTHIPVPGAEYSNHWLSAAPSEEDFTFAANFLGGRGENHVLHPASGVSETYGVGDKKAILDIARRTDPAENYMDNETQAALHNLMMPRVTNPSYSGVLPAQFTNANELDRRLNQMLLQEHGAINIQNTGPQYDNDLLQELLEQYKRQPRKYAQGGLVERERKRDGIEPVTTTVGTRGVKENVMTVSDLQAIIASLRQEYPNA